MNNRTLSLMMGAAGASSPAVYVEDVFSTFLYTGNGSTQTITNAIDLAGKGGLLWTKTRARSSGDFYSRHFLYDSARGLTTTSYLHTDSTDAQGATGAIGAPTFLGSGFTTGSAASANTETYTSWTFRKEPGFFDVVTYTGTGANRTVAHSLGSVPGCIIIKRTDSSGSNWRVYHRSLGNSGVILLDSTSGQFTSSEAWNNTDPTSTVFSLGTHPHGNASGGTYVAYLFAHDAQLFGDGGNQSVIKCGVTSSVGGYGTTTVELGWEPQWVLAKAIDVGGDWRLADNMRGIPVGFDKTTASLLANTSSAENNGSAGFTLHSTGFSLQDLTGGTTRYIYIAIRRGPMKTPTDATKVFGLTLSSGDVSIGPVQTSDASTPWSRIQDVDMVLGAKVSGDSKNFQVSDLLRGFQSSASQLLSTATTPTLTTSSTGPETASGNFFFRRVGLPGYPDFIQGGSSSANWSAYRFKRAPGFFDVVAYTGTGIAHGEAHNLGVAPELVIWKERSTASNWYVYQGFTTRTYGRLNLSNAFSGNTPGWFSSVTSTALNVCASSDNTDVNDSGVTYIAYLFATLTGISKVGSYTGTGTTLNIDCGFTNGARFVLIKCVNDVGDWYLWDTARGIVSGNDPYLLLNSTAAEVTNTDFIDPLSSGFQISSTAPAAINANGGSFIYLAIA